MARSSEIQSVIEKAVAEAIEAALPRLRAEIAQRIAGQLETLVPAHVSSSSSDLLNNAASSLQEAGSQAEILRQLLESAARFAVRVALFVVKGGSITGWQAIGFDDDDAIRNFSLDGSAPLVARAMQERMPVEGTTGEFDHGFMNAAKHAAEKKCLVAPLVVKDKIAALIYADAGTFTGGTLDSSGLGVLTRFAALWLELSALRKAGPGVQAEEPPPAAMAAAVSANPGLSTPSAATGAGVAGQMSEETELHKKAKRFAKLLVEEIKLYNQPKVVEGKQNRDLYERLREDIEKSRATYDKRYRESAVASADYFNQELIRILADNDVSLMGSSFPR